MNHLNKIEVFADNLSSDDCKHLVSRIGVRAIIKKDNHYALVYYQNWDMYTLPGGGVFENETKITALRREVFEETGYKIENIEPTLHLIEYFSDSVWENFYYRCDAVGMPSSLSLTVEEEAAGLKVVWVSFEEVLDIFSNHQTSHLHSDAIYQREFLGFIHSIHDKEDESSNKSHFK